MSEEEAREFVRTLISGSRRPERPRQARKVAGDGRVVVRVEFGWYGTPTERAMNDYTRDALEAATGRGRRRGLIRMRRAVSRHFRR